VNPRGLTLKAGVKKVTLVDTVTQKTVSQKRVTISTGIPEIYEIMSHLTNRICKEVHIDGQFSLVYPILKKYVASIFFGQEVDLENEYIRRLLCDAANTADIITTLAKAIGTQTITKTISKLDAQALSLMELDSFYWRREWTELNRTVFNITPCYNDFEKHFAKFLDTAGDITKFAKLAEEYTKFKIEYLNSKGALAYYYPDFVAEQKYLDKSRCMWLLETKGWEQENVPLKDARAEEWCADASKLTGIPWKYFKIKYPDYMSLTNNLAFMPTYGFEKMKSQLQLKHSGKHMEI
jgi:type III restriction enzyme